MGATFAASLWAMFQGAAIPFKVTQPRPDRPWGLRTEIPVRESIDPRLYAPKRAGTRDDAYPASKLRRDWCYHLDEANCIQDRHSMCPRFRPHKCVYSWDAEPPSSKPRPDSPLDRPRHTRDQDTMNPQCRLHGYVCLRGGACPESKSRPDSPFDRHCSYDKITPRAARPF